MHPLYIISVSEWNFNSLFTVIKNVIFISFNDRFCIISQFSPSLISDVVITCPTDGVGVFQAGSGVIIGIWSDPVCTGGVSPRSTSCIPQARTVIGVGDTQVTCTCTDMRGTIKQCTFTVSTGKY